MNNSKTNSCTWSLGKHGKIELLPTELLTILSFLKQFLDRMVYNKYKYYTWSIPYHIKQCKSNPQLNDTYFRFSSKKTRKNGIEYWAFQVTNPVNFEKIVNKYRIYRGKTSLTLRLNVQT